MIRSQISPYWVSLRPQQWTKNLIVFAAPLFGFAIKFDALVGSLLAFGLFCALSSGFYVVNDILDVAADRRHPLKCRRPIASGRIPLGMAWGLAIVLLGCSVTTGWFFSPGLGAALTAYATLQVAYNFKLKHTVILDVIAIATGFVLRAAGGAAATHILLSPWFLLCTAMLALFLAVEKRKAELRLHLSEGTTRTVLRHYSFSLLGRMEYTVTAGTVVTYALWSSGPKIQGASTPWMMLTLPFVLYGVFRYQLLSDPRQGEEREQAQSAKLTERPEDVLLKDGPMLCTVLGWSLTVFIILWLKQSNLLM